ncbi:hypothetical protein [Methylobacterium soli]|uniref:Tail fiber protein n=1 Tax=Methylobacterium soli TaxID=553447 RepID=A0A6L3SZ49_9HYPH|nr:hypothetical protein [Methylobacterium soli]KAB1079409.1 hypothetical protein F6X53_11440 [Methylobacterium soli]GJE45376.1 hypothetical protein AEGHOMDF_4570 [Methylobacterium soli]
MDIQSVNVGLTANDGTGDKPRVAFQKVNANFASVQEAVHFLKQMVDSRPIGTTPGTLADGGVVAGLLSAVSGKADTNDPRIVGALQASAIGSAVQPFDADLTAIAALATTAFGRSLLTLADQAAGRTALGAVSLADVNAAIALLVGAAPSTLDTIAEIDAAIGNDPNFATTMATALAGKAALSHTHTVSALSDASTNARSLLQAANYAAMRSLLTLVPGTAAGNVVALDGAAKLPAVDGSQLLNLPSGASDALATDLIWFGDGSDGSISQSSGTTTLTRDTYYNNVNLSGSATLITNGFRLHVLGTLDISGLTTGYIGFNGNPGGAPLTPTQGGAAGATIPPNSFGGAPAGIVGRVGTTGAGAAAVNGALVSGVGGGSCYAGGAGGAGSGFAGGAAQIQSNGPTYRLRRPQMDSLRGNTLLTGGAAGGSGGAAGGGDGTNIGGSGGGGGSAGPIVFIFARTINRSGSTGVGSIQAKGGNGGNGGTPAAGNCGGGGGGGGGAGGWVQIVYRFLTGTTATNCIDVTGGDGGLGGNGVGTGSAGSPGGSATGGICSMFNLATGVGSPLYGGSGSAASRTALVNQASL